MPPRRHLLVLFVATLWAGTFGCTDSPSPQNSGPPDCFTGRVYQPSADACLPARVQDVAVASDGDAADTTPPLRKWGDKDDDGVFNHLDNCPRHANEDQADSDGDGIGDPCDNCKNVANYDQKNTGSGPKGDACDEAKDRYSADQNSDDDEYLDIEDNCPNETNPDQTDSDGDGIGDACDNCPSTPNPTQTNSNQMGPGDACAPEPAGPVCRKVASDFKRFTPNLYFLLDKSGSMKGAKMNDASRAIVEIADRYQNRARFGLTAYSSDCSPPELLEMGGHSAAEVQESFNRIVATGKTGTAGALKTVRTDNRYLGLDESADDERPRAILIITDGDANVCGGLSGATTEAQSLKSNDVATYVIGFQSDAKPANLDQLAKAGGTDHHRSAADKQELIATVDSIFKQTIPCEFKLPDPQKGFAEHKIWVAIEGDYVAREQYTVDASTRKLTLKKKACQKLRNAESDPLDDPIEITMGCPDDCSSSQEICDYRDNDCDGEVDEGCKGCNPEVCDGKDNDCDQTTDEGCPDCQLRGETCTYDSNCCRGTCKKDNTCGRGCRPVGVKCTSGSQCCSGTCGGKDGKRFCTGS